MGFLQSIVAVKSNSDGQKMYQLHSLSTSSSEGPSGQAPGRALTLSCWAVGVGQGPKEVKAGQGAGKERVLPVAVTN